MKKAVFILLNILFLNQSIYSSQELSSEITAQYLLDKMLESQEEIQNFQCTSEFDQYLSNESRQREIDDGKRKGIDEIHIKNMQALLERNRGIEHKYQIDKLAFDNTGRARVENIYGIYNKSGEKMSPREIFITTWDNENAIEYSDYIEKGRRGAMLSNKRPYAVSERARHPLRSYGEHFYKAFSQTIAKGETVDITENKDGTYRIEFMNKNLIRVGTLDPTKGFSLIKQEAYRDGHLAFIYKAEFQEIVPGIWFPISSEDEVYFTKEPYDLRTKYTVKISDIKINDPSFNKNLFQVEFPDGTMVRDAITGIEFIVGDSDNKIIKKALEGTSSLLNKPLPELTDFTIDLNLTETKDKSVLLCFCDMNQRPSRHGVEELVKKAEELKGKGVWVAVVQTEPVGQKELEEWRAKYQIPFPVGMIGEEGEKVLAGWGVRGQPWLILTDRGQVVRAEGFGVEELGEKLKMVVGE